MNLLPPILAALGVLATAVVSYMVALKARSGNVKQTPAEKLWDAAEGLRQELAREVERQRGEITQLRTELEGLREEVRVLRVKVNG